MTFDPRTVDQVWLEFKETGDRVSRDRLMELFLPLVGYVAARVQAGVPGSVDVGDLLADGAVGLMDAIEKFDPQRGLRFESYAATRIRGAIIDGLRASDWAPRSVREKIREIRAVVVDLERHHGRPPSHEEIAAELLVSSGELHRTNARLSQATLQALEISGLNDEFAPVSLEGLPGADDGIPAGFVAALHELSERDQIVIALYYWDRLSQKEIGQVLGVTPSRVSQLRQHATAELRAKLRSVRDTDGDALAV